MDEAFVRVVQVEKANVTFSTTSTPRYVTISAAKWSKPYFIATIVCPATGLCDVEIPEVNWLSGRAKDTS